MEIVIAVLSTYVLASVYVIYNLLRKAEKLEDILDRYSKGLQRLGEVLSSSTQALREQDERGHFQVDDELGMFFESMKKAQQEINDTFLDIEDNA